MSDDPHAFKNLNEMGIRTTHCCPVELDVWRHVKDRSTGQKTGYASAPSVPESLGESGNGRAVFATHP